MFKRTPMLAFYVKQVNIPSSLSLKDFNNLSELFNSRYQMLLINISYTYSSIDALNDIVKLAQEHISKKQVSSSPVQAAIPTYHGLENRLHNSYLNAMIQVNFHL